jgi:mRNA-degrading endonuclease HigB of HigAB toxin-antitoxin module
LPLHAHHKTSALEQFWQKHPDAKASLEAWYGVVRKAIENACGNETGLPQC